MPWEIKLKNESNLDLGLAGSLATGHSIDRADNHQSPKVSAIVATV